MGAVGRKPSRQAVSEYKAQEKRPSLIYTNLVYSARISFRATIVVVRLCHLVRCLDGREAV